MVSYPLAQIPIAPASTMLKLNQKQTNMASPFSGSQTVIQYYSFWTLTINWPRMAVSKAVILAAWLDSLNGALGTFYWTPPDGVNPILHALTTNTVTYPGSQTTTLAGWSANAATGLLVGQMISFGGQLVRVTACPLTADASGHATIEFNVPMRSQVAAGAAVETTKPVGVFRMDTSQTAATGYQVDVDWIAEFPDAFTAVEAL